jgi:hypothetical protein
MTNAEQVYRHQLKRATQGLSKGIHAIDGDVKLNTKLWHLADEMAKEVA